MLLAGSISVAKIWQDVEKQYKKDKDTLINGARWKLRICVCLLLFVQDTIMRHKIWPKKKWKDHLTMFIVVLIWLDNQKDETVMKV